MSRLASTRHWSIIEGCYLPNAEGRLQLPNDNFDTGELTKPTAYPFADEAYAMLLAKVSEKPVSPELRSDILVYYADLGAPFATKKDPRAWQNVLDELGKLKGSPAACPEHCALINGGHEPRTQTYR